MASEQENKPVLAKIKNIGPNPRIFFNADNNPFEVLKGRTVEQQITSAMLKQLEKMVENGDTLEVNGKVSEAVVEKQEAEMEEAKLAQERAALQAQQQEEAAAAEADEGSLKSRTNRRRKPTRAGNRGGRHAGGDKDE